MVALVGGLDGCRAGWVFITTPVEGGRSQVEVVEELGGVFERLADRRLAAAGIDIPIGLPESGPRPCDPEARKLLGPRRSSVFPAPFRAVLGAETYDEANRTSRAVGGKGISRQAFALFPKISEVDDWITPERQRTLVEVHPEVCFTELAGSPMAFHKSTTGGRAERLHVLRGVFADLDDHVNGRLRGTQPDDVLDAFAAAWSARRYVAGTHRQLGGEVDGRVLRMEMIV